MCSVPDWRATSIVTAGLARMLLNHCGCSGAPPLDATTTHSSPKRRCTSGVVISRPVRAPIDVMSSRRSPHPPTPRPALEWNSSMVLRLNPVAVLIKKPPINDHGTRPDPPAPASLAMQGSLRYTAGVPIDGLATQLRKGVIEYCVLAMLRGEPRYGGELIQTLRDKGQVLVSEGTIYPLLSRLRSEGLVETEWRDTAAGAPRRYYRLTRSGHRAVAEFRDEWLRFRESVDGILLDGGIPG